METLEIYVKPGSSKTEITGIKDGRIIVFLKEKAEDGKANLALIKLLKKEYGKEARIIKGLKDRRKTVRFTEK